MRSLLAILLLVPATALAGCLHATGVEGRVLDRDTQSPIPGVEVKAVSGPKEHRAVTGADGRFTFDLEPGDWTLKAKVDGYLDSDAPVVVQKGDVATQDLFMTKVTK